jgi:HSP20 family molecular chaperone IbpA
MIRLFYANGWMWSVPRATAWEPQADVFETTSGYHVVVALPGIPNDRISLLLEESGLLLRALREPPSPRGLLRVRRMEIPYGPFERRIPLPPGRYVLREQRMVDGCLELLLVRE